ncbi:MAG: transcriptional activator NhaR [Myxococcales bacterium]|nr:transcriptional activator NhaR [Myxococcales bacterium]
MRSNPATPPGGVEWLNYHHLLYFWTVAKEGSVSQAARSLRLAQPTVSGQIKALEHSLDTKLFERKGRRLELTEQGRLVFRYAEDIFGLGRELMDTVKGRPTGRPMRLRVGISDMLPKLVAQRLLAPAIHIDEPVRIVCRGDKTDRLLAELALRDLDLVLSDVPVGAGVKVRAFNHLLGECGMTFFAVPKLARAYRRGFPKSLDGAPLILPTQENLVRRSLDHWFGMLDLRPRIIAEFDDSGLLKAFGRAGEGIFTAPSVVASSVREQYQVQAVGRTEDVRERFYAITVERRIKHPAVVAISESAKQNLFADAS